MIVVRCTGKMQWVLQRPTACTRAVCCCCGQCVQLLQLPSMHVAMVGNNAICT